MAEFLLRSVSSFTERMENAFTQLPPTKDFFKQATIDDNEQIATPPHQVANIIVSKSVALKIGGAIGQSIRVKGPPVRGGVTGVTAAATAAVAAAAGGDLTVGKELDFKKRPIMKDLTRLLSFGSSPLLQPAKPSLRGRACRELPPVDIGRPMMDHKTLNEGWQPIVENLKPATDLQSDLQWSLMQDDLQWPQKEATKGPPAQKGHQQPVTPPERPPPEQPLTKRLRRNISAECADRAEKVIRRAATIV